MDELHAGPRHPLSSADPESYFDLHMEPLDTNQKERATAGTWRGIIRLTPCRWDSLAFDRLPTSFSCPRLGEACQPSLATQLGDGNSDFKPIARGPCWHCPSLLCYSS